MKLKKMVFEAGNNRYLETTLKAHIEDILTKMEEDTELFETFLCSYPFQLRAVKNADGRHTSSSLYLLNHGEINYFIKELGRVSPDIPVFAYFILVNYHNF